MAKKPNQPHRKLAETPLKVEHVERNLYKVTDTAPTGEPVVTYVQTISSEALAKIREAGKGLLPKKDA